MADLDKPSLIEDAPSAPETDATPAQDAPPVEESAPAPEQYVPILPGDDLATLAKRWNTTAEKVVERNKLNPDFIHPWQWVWV